MKTLQEKQEEYARLVLSEGLALQKGQLLAIDCPVDQAWFARICARIAYAMGCREVVMNWEDDTLAREKYLHAADEVFDTVHSWTADFFEKCPPGAGHGWAIHAADPENLRGCDPDRIQRAQIASGQALAGFRRRETNNEFPWCVCSIPTEKWATKVFPDLDTAAGHGEAVGHHPDHGLCGRRRRRGQLAGAYPWELERRHPCAQRYGPENAALHERSGTDLTVELPEGHFWAGGAEKCVTSGVSFSANIPSEEVFTLPVKTGVNGVVYASKPLSLHGNLIEDFGFELKDGKIVRAFAKKGEEVLQKATAVDEGSVVPRRGGAGAL